MLADRYRPHGDIGQVERLPLQRRCPRHPRIEQRGVMAVMMIVLGATVAGSDRERAEAVHRLPLGHASNFIGPKSLRDFQSGRYRSMARGWAFQQNGYPHH
jgi:hypothetical protein